MLQCADYWVSGVLVTCCLWGCGTGSPAPSAAAGSLQGATGGADSATNAGNAGAGETDVAGSGGGPADAATIPTSFRWTSSGPLISPVPNATHPILSVKDPSIVYYGDRYHVFATTANTSANWSMVYLNFASWEEAGQAPLHFLDENPVLAGYHAAPHIFFFTPHDKWYLIFQSGQPQYSTADDLTRPETWTAPVNFFAGEPPGVTANKGMGGWLDFYIICDEVNCFMFFTDDDGEFFRSQTSIESFPNGFSDPVVAIQGTKETLFEASQTYEIEGTSQYLTIIEAFGPNSNRYFRSFVADSLDGEWTPLADTWDNPFAGAANVTFESGTAWTGDISHGDLLRTNYDQTATIALDRLQFLYQGVDPGQTNVEYYQLPYRLGLLTRSE